MTLSRAPQQALHEQVRDSIAVDKASLEECIDETIAHMQAHLGRQLRAQMASSPLMTAHVSRLTVDLALLLSMTKTQESEEVFEGAFGLLTGVDFNGPLTNAYAKAMVRTDHNAMEEADAYIYECLPADIVRKRLDQVVQFIDRKAN